MSTTPTRHFKDIDMSFGRHPQTGDVLKKVDFNAIRQSIRNLILTSPGERPFQPYVGTPIHEMLFDLNDTVLMTTLDQMIERTIQNYEPRVTLLGTKITRAPDQHSVDIAIAFREKTTGAPGTFTITINRLR